MDENLVIDVRHFCLVFDLPLYWMLDAVFPGYQCNLTLLLTVVRRAGTTTVQVKDLSGDAPKTRGPVPLGVHFGGPLTTFCNSKPFFLASINFDAITLGGGDLSSWPSENSTDRQCEGSQGCDGDAVSGFPYSRATLGRP